MSWVKRLWSFLRRRQLDDDLDEELRFQYLIGYYPTNCEQDGTFRRIEIRPDKSRWRVRTRSGYYATP